MISAIGAAFAVAASGFFIMRQQRRALALESELRYARAVAAARDLENQLVRAEKLITVGVLSTEMAHEIGSPLAVIRGRAEQVLREVSAGRARRTSRSSSSTSTTSPRRSARSSTSRAAPPTERRPVSLQSAVERARELLGWKLDARHIALEVAVQDDLPMLTADRRSAAAGAGEPAPQRLRRLEAGRAHPAGGARRATAGWCASGSSTRARASRPSTCRRCSIRSSPPSRAAKGPASGCRSRPASCATTAGGSISPARPASGTTATVLWPAEAERHEAHA